jgi:hypothetical protein
LESFKRENLLPLGGEAYQKRFAEKSKKRRKSKEMRGTVCGKEY